jgi:hypothetical protein
MNRLSVLLLGTALIGGGSALASAQPAEHHDRSYVERDHGQDQNRDRDGEREKNEIRERDRDDRYRDRDFSRERYDRYDRSVYADRNNWRWDGQRWMHWDGYRWVY